MITAPAAPFYAVVEAGFALYGVGTTEAEAVAEAEQWTEHGVDLTPAHRHASGDMVCVPCTQALYDEMSGPDADGSTGWDILRTEVGFVAMTSGEAAAILDAA